MKPTLPRPLLWTEVVTMNEFFNGNVLSLTFHEVFKHLNGTLFLPYIDEVQLFNEVYYQLTRFYYERPTSKDYLRYAADIKANLGWAYSADLVLTMMYHYVRVQNIQGPIHGQDFLKHIRKMHEISLFWDTFSRITSSMVCWLEWASYPQKPCPVNPKNLEGVYLDWKEITHDYDLETVKEVLNLWGKNEDKRFVAKMIEGSMLAGSVCPRHPQKYQDAKNYLKEVMNEDMKWGNSIICAEPTLEEQRLQEELKQQSSTNKALLCKIEEMKEEIGRLNTLLEKNKNEGEKRKFTLLEIVNYCKNCVVWDDAKSIVAMLNKFLRQIGKEEDSILVDSIEAEFRNRRYGITHKEIVLQKHVETEIQNVEAGGTGVNKEIKKDRYGY